MGVLTVISTGSGLMLLTRAWTGRVPAGGVSLTSTPQAIARAVTTMHRATARSMTPSSHQPARLRRGGPFFYTGLLMTTAQYAEFFLHERRRRAALRLLQSGASSGFQPVSPVLLDLLSSACVAPGQPGTGGTTRLHGRPAPLAFGRYVDPLAGDKRAGYWRGPAGCPPECPGIEATFHLVAGNSRGSRGLVTAAAIPVPTGPSGSATRTRARGR